jgi:hypothetical protein
MLAANIWHWWIGVAMLIVGVLLVVALVAGYLKSVTAPQFPPERRQRASKQDL